MLNDQIGVESVIYNSDSKVENISSQIQQKNEEPLDFHENRVLK